MCKCVYARVLNRYDVCSYMFRYRTEYKIFEKMHEYAFKKKLYNKTKEVVITIQGAMYIYLSVRMNPSSSMKGNLWFGFFFTNSG